MDEKGKYIRSYTTADIRRYLDGELSPAEMHALEKTAMDDPFLADAISGMEWNDVHKGVPFETATAELKRRLLEKTEQAGKRRGLPLLPRWQAAAALLLLLAAGYTGYLLLIKNSAARPEVSVIPHNKPASDTIIRNISPAPQPVQLDTIYAPAPKNEVQSAHRATREAASDQQPVKPEAKKAASGNAARVEAAPVKTEAEVTKKSDEIKTIESPAPGAEKDRAGKALDTELAGKLAGVEIQKARRKNGNIRPAAYLEGHVTDSIGQPIAAATVKTDDDRAATVTDKKGYFKLGTRSRDSIQDVAVTALGYLPATSTIALSRSRDNSIRLQSAGDELDEVVVTGYGAKKERRALEYAAKDTAVAVRAPAAWYDYFNSHKKIPATDSSLHGTETISFLVHKNGKLSGFKIEQSLSPVHDAELIRLIRTGPPWTPASGKKERVRVTVTF